jgi:hypothetical protein
MTWTNKRRKEKPDKGPNLISTYVPNLTVNNTHCEIFSIHTRPCSKMEQNIFSTVTESCHLVPWIKIFHRAIKK